MQIEFEAKFTNISKDDLRAKLKQIGAILLRPEFLMKRVVFDPPIKIPGGWLRVRDEGDKIYMSLKVVDGAGIKDQKETEIEIGNFETGCKLLASIGARRKAYQETKREIWQKGEVKFDIDTWPGLNPFLEIEGSNESQIKIATTSLGLEWSQAKFGAVDIVYLEELGITHDEINNQITEITFANPPRSKK